MSHEVTVLGAGKLGAAFVARWAAAERPVRVWNRSSERAQALAAESAPAQVVAVDGLTDAVAGVPLVVSLLTNGAAIVDVLVDQGAIAAMAPGTTLVDFSTVDVASSERVAEEAVAHGVHYMRGGVSGTAAVVRAGGAGLLLSGPPEAFGTAHPPLAEISETHIPLGREEEARVAKLAVNLVLGSTMQSLAEAIVLAEAAGLSRAKLFRALEGSVLFSRFMGYKAAALTERNYAPTFRTADMRKDAEIAAGLAADAGLELPGLAAVVEQLRAAEAAGYADQDFAALLRITQQGSGQPVD